MRCWTPFSSKIFSKKLLENPLFRTLSKKVQKAIHYQAFACISRRNFISEFHEHISRNNTKTSEKLVLIPLCCLYQLYTISNNTPFEVEGRRECIEVKLNKMARQPVA